jgi:hypothetical protein
MKQKLERALWRQERNQNELNDLAADVNKSNKAVENAESTLAALPGQSDWMTPDDLKLKETAILNDLKIRKADRYRLELKRIKAETILTISQNNLNEAERLIDIAAKMKFPWS